MLQINTRGDNSFCPNNFCSKRTPTDTAC